MRNKLSILIIFLLTIQDALYQEINYIRKVLKYLFNIDIGVNKLNMFKMYY